MKKYDVLYTADSLFFSHMITSIYSLLLNNQDVYLTVHVIESKFSESQKRLLQEIISCYNADVKLYSIESYPNIIQKYNIPKWRDTDIANARLFAHEIIKDVEKILYIDSDTIIVDSLDSLFQKELSNPVGAVKEFFLPYHMKDIILDYYNSGVILFDYSIWEDENCIDLIRQCLKLNREILYYPDQDLLNMALQNKIDTLNVSYNINPAMVEISKYPYLAKHYFEHENNVYSFSEISEGLKNPHIYHMLEYFYIKPWEKNRVHPFNQLYKEYRNKWDQNFKVDETDNLLAQIKFLSFFKCCLNAFLTKEEMDHVKKLLKLYKGPEIK